MAPPGSGDHEELKVALISAIEWADLIQPVGEAPSPEGGEPVGSNLGAFSNVGRSDGGQQASLVVIMRGRLGRK